MTAIKTVLITGATGFLGSGIAASFLVSGHHVIALSRNDPDGARTRAAIAAAGAGLGIDPDDLHRQIATALSVIECGFRDLASKIPAWVSGGVDEVWNCVANMNYSLEQLEESIARNVHWVQDFYLRLAQEPRISRFYHVSTAYTASLYSGSRLIREDLHPEGVRVNAYHISKWMAEGILARVSADNRLPVTIFRPSIIVGSRQTGWSASKSFGYYMFIRSLRRARQRGIRRLAVNLDPEVRPNLISIDDVVRWATALCRLSKGRDGAHFEIIHAVNQHTLTLRQHFAIASEVIDIEVCFGEPATRADQRFQAGIELNREFAARTWNFERERLQCLVGSSALVAPWMPEEIPRMIHDFSGSGRAKRVHNFTQSANWRI